MRAHISWTTKRAAVMGMSVHKREYPK
jgi:hypothetical protein